MGEGEIIKAGSNTVFSLKNLRYAEDTVSRTFFLDLSVDSLQAQGFVPENFHFEEGDFFISSCVCMHRAHTFINMTC